MQHIVQILQETCIESLKISSNISHINIEIPNTLCRTADRYTSMSTQQQSSSSSSYGQGFSATEGEDQTSPESVGGTSISNVWQGVVGAQHDTSRSNSNISSLILLDLNRSFSDVPPNRRFHPPYPRAGSTRDGSITHSLQYEFRRNHRSHS